VLTHTQGQWVIISGWLTDISKGSFYH